MNAEQWEQVKEIFGEALERPGADRIAFVRGRCGDDAVVCQEVLRLVQFSPTVGARLDYAAVSAGLIKHAADRVSAMSSLEPGEVLAERFEIVRWLGAGGMGEVYEAVDRVLSSRVAIKTIRPEIADDPQVLSRFRREVNLARQVTHPNVCRVFDLAHGRRGNGTELDFLTMEYLEGETLSTYLEGRPPLTLAEAAPIVRQIAEALGAAHDAGIVHRDLKGSNIFLARNREGEIRVAVTDFGLARSVLPTEHPSLTVSGWGAGTPAYMAPEQVEGRVTGKAADFYSFGVVMYEMATGAPPYTGHSPLEIAVRRLKEKPKAPREVNPKVDPKWEAVILRCLEYDPADRFPDASSLLSALGTRTRLPGFRPTVRRRISRSLRWAVPIIALLAVALWWLWRTPSLPEPVARMYTEGINALADGSYLKANRLLEQTVQQQPNFVPATLRLAETYLELDQSRKAQETLLRVSDRWLPSTETRLLRDALRLLLLRDYDAAIPILKRRAEAANSTQTQLDLGRALERANRLEESQAAYREVLKRDAGHAGALLRMATVASANLDRPTAERYVQLAQQAYSRFGNAEGQGEADLLRANMAKDLSALDEARGFAQAGADRGRQTGSLWLEIRAQLVEAAIDVLAAKPEAASQKAEAAVARAREAGLETLACQGLIDLGMAYLSQVQDERAEKVHREALAIAERNDAPFSAASARLGLAMDLSGQARGAESVATARQAQAYFSSTNFRLKKVEALRVLGHAYFSLNDWDQASQYYGVAAALANQPWEAILRLKNLESQANVEIRRGNFPQVRATNLAILKEAGARKLPPLTAAQARLSLANVARLLGHFPEAERLTEELLRDRAIENPGFREQVVAGRVALLAEQGQTAAALALADEVIAAAGRKGRKANRADMEIRRCWMLAEDPAADARLAVRACNAVLATMANRQTQGAADANQALAEAYLRMGNVVAAQPANEVALAHYQTKRRANEVFYCRLLETAIHLAGGRATDAAASRTAASAVFRTMTATWPLGDQQSYLARPAVWRMTQRANWTQER